ncbi:PRELI domain-containing protein 1, mitochondrial [Aplysia californica]|uniref:PRELI domain-containing protein 1, mitochondrial n=1 Tax=Aplysia californica TaxID=6500 RepID=A0ABM0K1C1_APLCA|nr:PRELI domain-containing protein 1, mitochondrial [Aplysia californica]
MVKFLFTCSVFKYSWEQVATGLWQRYPNPNSKHVLTEDVISRHTDGNKLISRRVLTKTNKIPKWGERFVGGDSHVLIIEESVVDPDQKTLTTYTRNIGLQKIMSVDEKCVYRTSPDNSSWTVCERSAFISSSLPFGFSKPIEVFGVKRFRANAEKAAQGFDYVLHSLFKPDSVKDHPLVASSKIKDTARRAAEMAKSKTAMLQRASS